MNVKHADVQRKPLLFGILLTTMLFFSSSCISMEEAAVRSMGGDEVVIKVHTPVIYIEPSIHEWNKAVGIFLLHDIQNRNAISYDLTAKLQQRLLQKRLFRQVSLMNLSAGNAELAVQKGLELGFDYVITGHINAYVIQTSTYVPPKVSLTLRIIECKTGNTLWYMEDTVTGDVADIRKRLQVLNVHDYPETGYLADILLNTIVDHLVRFKRKGEYRSSSFIDLQRLNT